MTNDEARFDRAALAHEVIVSAANVLRAAGFDRDEIAAFFDQAARQLDGDRGTSDQTPLAAVARRFAENDAVLELQALCGEAEGLLPCGEDLSRLRRAFDIAMRMVPALAEAQAALRNLAMQAGMPLVVSVAERERGDSSVCLEEFSGAYSGVAELLGALADALVERGDSEAFAFLLGHLAENGVIVFGPLQASLARGAALLDN